MSKKEKVLPDHRLQKCMIKWLQQHKMKSLITLKDRKVCKIISAGLSHLDRIASISCVGSS